MKSNVANHAVVAETSIAVERIAVAILKPASAFIAAAAIVPRDRAQEGKRRSNAGNPKADYRNADCRRIAARARKDGCRLRLSEFPRVIMVFVVDLDVVRGARQP